MKKAFFVLTLLLQTGTFAPLRGDDLRVEWLSGKPIEALRFEAGAGVLRLCSSTSPQHCLELEPGTTARCVSSSGVVNCKSARTVQQFQKFTAASASPFRIEKAVQESAASEAHWSGLVRAAEVRVTPRGFRVVIPVDLENYVTGVLNGEAGTFKSSAALQAMAVVARTWALRWRGRHRREGFDFCSLTHCQVFRLPSEAASGASTAISAAARETTGKVLKYRGDLIDPYFSANCGGITEAAANVWPDRAAPYLVSVRDPYCAGSEHSSWEQTLSLATVRAILSENISVVGPLLDLKIEDADNSGRAHTLRLESGSTRRLDANEFRYAVDRRLGWNTLKSNLYTLDRRGDSLVFTGRGLGHGVGLCQAGADQMGRMGIAYEKILASYFPGASVAENSSVTLNDPVLSSEHFELFFPEGQHRWVNETLYTLETIRRELANRLERQPARIRVVTFQTTAEFIRAANQPGWVAAVTDGISITLQPLESLKRKGILISTLRHEITHLAVRRRCAREIPRWFEEGLVLYLTKEQATANSGFDFRGRSLEESVAKPRSAAEMKAAYALALERVRGLARERGEPALWQVIEHPSDGDLRWFLDHR